MEIINPWTLYLILQADSIKSGLGFISLWAILISGAMVLLWVVYIMICSMQAASIYNVRTADEYKASRAAALRKWWVVALAVVISGMVSLLNALLPSTKSAAMLLVIPALANSEVVQTEARELYDLAKQGLADLVMEEARKTPPQESTDGRDTAGE